MAYATSGIPEPMCRDSKSMLDVSALISIAYASPDIPEPMCLASISAPPCFDPNEYEDDTYDLEDEWTARVDIDLDSADTLIVEVIKCPSAPPRVSTGEARARKAAAKVAAKEADLTVWIAAASARREAFVAKACAAETEEKAKAEDDAAKAVVSRTVRSARAHVLRMKRARARQAAAKRCFF